jgi:hypothetical protein
LVGKIKNTNVKDEINENSLEPTQKNNKKGKEGTHHYEEIHLDSSQ